MSHRRAFGPQRLMSDATKARNIAASILAHAALGTVRTMADYGIAANAALVALVEAELTKQVAQAA